VSKHPRETSLIPGLLNPSDIDPRNARIPNLGRQRTQEEMPSFLAGFLAPGRAIGSIAFKRLSSPAKKLFEGIFGKPKTAFQKAGSGQKLELDVDAAGKIFKGRDPLSQPGGDVRFLGGRQKFEKFKTRFKEQEIDLRQEGERLGLFDKQGVMKAEVFRRGDKFGFNVGGPNPLNAQLADTVEEALEKISKLIQTVDIKV